ncbi:DUF4232 domain-containing protein [Jatrophihabitans telluris]|uniref:DUF4232 domain-containing protein n=1 Tax=Jatrophihabitans telluris TaxID=2038343 RepID=A0ABY4QZY1_9ACTN|nr:DUF4232 domain-containing protein [Jatrophihabitans telluris]UQX88647.1 DUF4232 domain-containing protein [Jatrophihabitans telluris]
MFTSRVSTVRVVTRYAVAASSAVLAAAALAAVTGAGAGASTPPSCSNAVLRVTHAPQQGATGHGSVVVLFRNAGPAACTLFGYPGFDAISASGHVLAHARRTLNGFAGGATAVRTITLPSHGYASATAEWMNFNPQTSGPCAFSHTVNSTPPNTTRTTSLTIGASVCDLQIHPVVAGTTHNDAFARAQVKWMEGAKVSSAQHNAYWIPADHYLKADGSTYAPEIHWLEQLIHLPITGQTHAQNVAYRTDIHNLNLFFGTPGLYG